MTIYTAGYISHSVSSLKRHAIALKALVMDIRYGEYSSQPAWQGYCLRARLGRKRYVHNALWGIRRHWIGQPFQIDDWEEGLRYFQQVIEERKPDAVILLCACRSAMECHRTEIARRLRAEGYEVKEMLWLKPARRKPVRRQKTVGAESTLPLFD